MNSERKGIYASGLWEDILLCTAAVYFSASFGCDNYLSDSVTNVIRTVSTLIMLLCWFGISLLNGLRMRKVFALFSTCFLMFPAAVSVLYEHIRPFRFSDAGLLIKRAAEITGSYPYLEIEKLTAINGIYLSGALSVICLTLFIAGYLYTKHNIIDK